MGERYQEGKKPKEGKFRKILFLGNPKSGKSKLISRIADDVYADSYFPTNDVVWKIRFFDRDKTDYKVQIYEVFSDKRHEILAQPYYVSTDAIVVVVDLTDENSLVTINDQLSKINAHANKPTPVIIAATKSDIESEYKHSFDELKSKVQVLKKQFSDLLIVEEPIKCSAKNNENCDAIVNVSLKAIKEKEVEAQAQQIKENDPDDHAKEAFKKALQTYVNNFNSNKSTDKQPNNCVNLKRYLSSYFTQIARIKNVELAKKMLADLENTDANTKIPKYNLKQVLKNNISYRFFSSNYGAKTGFFFCRNINSNAMNNAIRDAKLAVNIQSKAKKSVNSK